MVFRALHLKGRKRSYDDPETFRGRAVLVVGGRSSGVDIARELKPRVKRLYDAWRKGPRPLESLT